MKYRTIIILLLGFSIVIIVAYSYQFGIGLWNTPEKWGQLGDFFGGVLNPFIGFFTILLLLVTLTQNQKALEYNKDELELTRKELSESKKALQDQAAILAKQSFDSTFFNMVSFLNDSVSSIEFKKAGTGNIIKGKKSLQLYHAQLIKVLEKSSHKDYTTEQHVKRQVEAFTQQYDREIGYYFKQIKNILKFIDLSDTDNKIFYGSIISSQLSMHEKSILFYYALPEDDYKLLVEKYALLSGLITKHFNWESGQYDPYSPKAYEV